MRQERMRDNALIRYKGKDGTGGKGQASDSETQNRLHARAEVPYWPVSPTAMPRNPVQEQHGVSILPNEVQKAECALHQVRAMSRSVPYVRSPTRRRPSCIVISDGIRRRDAPRRMARRAARTLWRAPPPLCSVSDANVKAWTRYNIQRRLDLFFLTAQKHYLSLHPLPLGTSGYTGLLPMFPPKYPEKGWVQAKVR
jgi:hypothetical protein